MLVGSNGNMGSDANVGFWQNMGLTWSRASVGPGQATSTSVIDVSQFDNGDAASEILRNNLYGVRTVLLLAYTSTWNASIPGDSDSAPLDETAWTNYVEAAVQKWSAPPYNVKFFQIWNEAAGSLTGGSPQASFWHGPGYNLSLQNVNSGLCVDLNNNATVDGTPIHQWDCLSVTSQNFYITPVNTTQSEIYSPVSGKCLEIPSGSLVSGTQLDLMDCNQGSNQLWTVTYNPSGTLAFTSVATGLCMDLASASTIDGGAVQVDACNGANSQQFWQIQASDTVPYANAMSDYVDRIHIPAAKIIRQHGAYVVYGGWPDQGGLSTYYQWLEYTSTVYNSRMLDWTDYLDVHYLGVNDMASLYQRYGTLGLIRGVWQTEIGFDYMNDQNYLPSMYFNLAVFALNNNWNDADQFAMMIYHWSGGQAFMLMDQSSHYHPSGLSLAALRTSIPGVLSAFTAPITMTNSATAVALYSDNQIVFEVTGNPGSTTLTVTDLPAPASGNFTVTYVDAYLAVTVPSAAMTSSWTGSTLTLNFTIPAQAAGVDGVLRNHMGYITVTPQ